jgi:hypothetical protein
MSANNKNQIETKNITMRDVKTISFILIHTPPQSKNGDCISGHGSILGMREVTCKECVAVYNSVSSLIKNICS